MNINLTVLQAFETLHIPTAMQGSEIHQSNSCPLQEQRGDTCHEAAAAAIYWTTFPLPVIKTQ
jgi:hypothetical protein